MQLSQRLQGFDITDFIVAQVDIIQISQRLQGFDVFNFIVFEV